MLDSLLPQAQAMVMVPHPDVLAHNAETVEALQRKIRPQAGYRQSLELLKRTATRGFVTKSGFMVGLGETEAKAKDTLHDLAGVGLTMVTVGQCLQPAQRSLFVTKYWILDKFEEIGQVGRSIGLTMMTGPLVCSSFHAEQLTQDEPIHRSEQAKVL